MEEWLRRQREEREYYDRWAAIQEAINPDQGFREGGWLASILGNRARYSGDPEADAYVQGLREEALREEAFGEDLPEYGPRDVVTGVAQEEAFTPGPDPTTIAAVEEDTEKEPDLLNKLFLMSLMENMQGGDIGQAPAVVAGGGRREFPTMMRQFAPWEREKPYWWLR